MTGKDAEEAALRFLGLARRAGALEAGVEVAGRAVRSGRARLLVTAVDASPAQVRKVRKPAERAGVPVRVMGTRVGLGHAVGGPPLSAVAVTDEGFAEQLLRRLPETGATGTGPK